jgi:Fe-S-cluster-containing dehydrogenase component
MSGISRRDFFKISGAMCGAATLSSVDAKAQSRPVNILSDDRMGVLVDTTVCIGCRNCEWACKDAHGIPTDHIDTYQDRTVFKEYRRPNEQSLTVVNEYKNPKSEYLPTNVKIQCMHCDHPSCVSVCIVGAFSKLENGSVVWDTSKCIGCRYCMVACPFQIPTYEFERTKQGKLTACVEICPVEALTYGSRQELIKIARKRIQRNPDRYINQIYGEKEVGGTAWMYLAGQDFGEIEFKKFGDKPAPGISESIQHGIFAYFVPPAMFYSLLGMIMWIAKKRETEKKEKQNQISEGESHE